MELRQVKNRLLQTECGELIMDRMDISEPMLTKDKDGLVDNFFIYLVDMEEHINYGPVGRAGIDAETGKLKYLVSCNENPFSKKPTDIITAGTASATGTKYEAYSKMYPCVRAFAFKEHCSDEERRILRDYYHSFLGIVNPALLPFYKEMAPSFFSWVERTLQQKG